MKKRLPRQAVKRYVGYLNGKPVNECQATNRMTAWEMLWGLLRRSDRTASKDRFSVQQEDLETKLPA